MSKKEKTMAGSVLMLILTGILKAVLVVFWIILNVLLLLGKELQKILHKYLFNKEE
jgi:hypothetical protein